MVRSILNTVIKNELDPKIIHSFDETDCVIPKVLRRDGWEDIAVYTQLTQTVRYYGPEFVREYWNEMYNKKVA